MAKASFSVLFALIFLFLQEGLQLYTGTVTAAASDVSGLSYGFYDKSCPNLEEIIQNVVFQKFKEAFNTAAGALRIFFHDCFVEVGSVPAPNITTSLPLSISFKLLGISIVIKGALKAQVPPLPAVAPRLEHFQPKQCCFGWISYFNLSKTVSL